ncbi:hypothetical protein [Streptomyces sp. NPDC051567]|uniref:WXG100-like domain-containing protein n=1 Tax=Streptomyces sp. NPDC051567 TaxID=3365660 RepID=UPI0037B7C37B
MAINPPEGIADFLAFVSGMEWPEADEDLMRRVSEHYGSIARDLETLSGYVIELIPIVKNDFDGEAADSFLVAMRDLTGQTAGANQLEQTAELSRQLSEVALKVANQVEYTKIMAILQLVQLLAEILFATLFSPFTFGAVWGPVSALFAATREGLHQLLRWLLQTIISQTFIGIIGGIFQDTVIQLYQLNAGHTTSWNTESLLDSIKQGALSGVVAGPLEILSHYGGNLLGRLLGGKTPGSIISKRVDDVLNKIDDKLDDITPNPKPDVPTGGAGAAGGAGGAGSKSKLDDLASKTDKDLPPTPPNKAPNDVTPPPVPPKTVGDGIVPPPATGRPKPETPGGATAKDKPNAPATGTTGAPAPGKGNTPTTGKGDVPTTGKGGAPTTGKSDVPTTGKGDIPTTGKGDAPATGKTDTPATGKADVPAANKTETVGGNEAPGAGKATAGDTPSAGASAKAPDASTAGRAVGDAGTPLDDLLATKEARSAFAKDVGELLGGVSRNLETGFMRFGEGTIADSFSKKMGDVFSEHLGKAGAREAGEAFGEMLTRKWVRLGADHTELPELLTKAMGDFGRLAPLKSLADSMPNLFARSEHSNTLARIFKQENPLQGNPMYQLGGAVASLLNEGTNEMLSEGFYNLIFGDGTFTVSGGPFAAGVAMGALSHGLHRAFEPIMVRYQNWVLSHQHAENPHDSKYFGLLHPINIASFVANMTGNPAPWPVPRPTSEVQDPSFTRDMKDMVKWVFSNPITGTPFFADLPQRPDVTVESDGGGAFTPLDLDLGPSFGDEIAKDPLFRTESDGDTSTDDGGKKEGEEGSDTAVEPSRATVSSDLSSLLGGDTESLTPDLTDQNQDQDQATARPVTQGGGDRFTTSVPQETGSPSRTEVPAQAEATTGPRPHPLQAEKDRAAAEGLDYLLPYDDTTVPDNITATDDTMTPVGDGDGNHRPDDDGGDGGDGTTPPPDAPVRDIPSGIAVGVLTPAQAAALQAFPPRPGVFVVGTHTDPRTPHDPDAVLKALTDAHDDGRLDGITEIQFTACDLASPVHENTVRTVMSGLWKHRATTGTTAPDPLTARAADAPVWYVPTTGGDTAGGHLLTARHIGLTPDGKIAVVDEGAWHVYGDSGGPDHTPVRTTPGPDALPDDAVRFLFRTPAIDAEHPDAVKFGRNNGLPDALSHHLPRERWTALLSDPAAADLLAEVTETRRSPGDAWHTMDARTYRELRNRLLGDEGNDLSAEAVEEAFSAYPPELSTDAAGRLEAVVTLVRELHADAEEGPLTPDVQILLQRLLLDQGFPPARLPDAARATTFWKKNETGFLTAELTLGMADVTDAGNAPLTGALTVAPAPTPSDGALSELLQDPDESRGALLRELLDGAHLPGSPWHTLGSEAYLTLRSRVEGGPLDDPGTEVRETLDRVFEEYGEALKRATTRVEQLKAVADTVLTLHATGGLTGSPENALTAHSRFLVPRMLLDLGITPVPLPAKLHAKPAWQAPKIAKMRNTRVLTFATSVARAVMDARPSWSRPPTSAPADGGTPEVTPPDDRATGTSVPATSPAASPAASGAPVATHTPAPQDGPARDGDGDAAPEPGDWRAELDALGARTREETTAYLVLPESPLGLVGRADRLLRTDDRPYTTLTKDLPPGTEHWLAVRVPAGHAVGTGDGRLLVGKDRLAAVTLTGPAGTIGPLQALERGLRPPGSPEQPLPLAVLSRVGQALYANPGHDEHHTVVRTAVREAYAEASRDAERALGEYLTGREDVQRQVRALVEAAWNHLSADERRRLGTAQNTGSGSVGDDLRTLEEVVRNGNIRERMHLLVTGVHGPVRERLGLKKPEPEILTRERSAHDTPEAQRIQQDADVVQNIKREQERLRKEEADNPGLEALLRAQDHRRRTELRPEEAVPPLSERERVHALEEGRLTWEPGERHRQIALRTKSQVTAEATGGLMSAGTSNTTYFALTVVHAMAKKWNVPVDFQLVRLALMADMLPIGHHTFHEVMTASEAFERDVPARQPRPAGAPPYADVLSYTDDWGRFRSLAPLTENTLREAMPGGRFPDEVALGLEAHERTPDTLPAPSPVRRTLRALPDSELTVLLDATPAPTGRAAGLLREALGDGGNTSRDWRRLNADSYLDLHERVTRPDDAVQDPQTGVWDELGSIMERWYGMDPDVPAPDPLRQSLDSAFDAYDTALAGDPGDGTRLTALADLLLKLRKPENLPPSDTDVSTALGVMAQRLLVDQGYPPALWGEDVGAPDFWPDDAPSLVRKLETAIGEFTRRLPVRQTPTGIAVGPMNAAQSRVLASLPPRPGVFVVGTHTDPNAPHDPDAVLKALTDAHDDGRLDGITEIRFTGCDLAAPVHEATVRTVMSGLWKHRAATGTENGPLTALAADAPVWYVPGGEGLFTARHVGVTADGKVTVLGDGADWHRYSDTGAPGHTAVSTPVGDDGAPADAVRTTRDDGPAHEDAVRFGDEDGETESSSFSMTSAGLVPRQWTIDFGKGEKTLTEEGRTVVRGLARELFPELVRRAFGPSPDPLDIRVAAGGNNLFPGAAKEVGMDRAHAVAGALATAIRELAVERNLPEVERLAVFTPTTRGRDTTGFDLTGDASPSVLRRRGTVLAELHPLQRVLERSATMNLAELAVFRQLADLTDSRRMTFSLDELVGSRVYRTSGATPLEEHNVVFRLETHEMDRSTRRDWASGLVTFTPDTRVEVVSFQRTDSGRSLVTLREVHSDDREDRSLGTSARDTPAIGLPGVGYAGPNRPFDSTLVHHKAETEVTEEVTDEATGEVTVVTRTVNESRYEFRKALYIHRGEVDVEMTEKGPHVRFYTAVTNQTALTIDRESGDVTAGYKDIQQDPETGRVVLATGPNMGGTLWTGIGTPARAVAWAMKYKAEDPDVNRPLIRSYLVPLHVYHEITSTAVPEGDVNSLGDPYRGSESLVPQGLREPLAVPDTPEGVAYRQRSQAREKGSAPDPVDGPTPLTDRTINTDQPGERNQFGIRGSHLALLRESVLANSLVTYHERDDRQDLTREDEGSEHSRNGEVLHVDALRDRLGIPGVGAPQLKSEYNPWVQNRKHVNRSDKLRSISNQLRQFYVTWQQSRQQPADRRPSPLVDPDATVLAYDKRLDFLEKFLKDHNQYLRDENGAELTFGFLRAPDPDPMSPADDAARATVENFMVDTALTWASHAEIGYLLSRQHQEVKGDRNISDAPLTHDFDEMRRRRKEDVHLQLRAGEDLTRLWREGEPTHRLINRLIRDYPELSLLYGEICAPSERYTFFQHAQMVLGQYLKLAHRDMDDSRRVVPVDAIVKAILFHDIEKANSKVMYGEDKEPDPDQEPEEKKPKKGPTKKEQHDYEAEHRGAVDLMSRYRHLWGDVDGDKDLARTYRAAVMMVDSDPFGFYYRKKHHAKDTPNRDATFHWIVEAYMRLRGKPLLTSDGITRRLATLDDGDTEGVRRLFHEFHQYYQADFSSYTRYSGYRDYEAPERTRQGETPRPENPGVFGAAPRQPAKEMTGKETFTQQFVSDEGQEPLDPGNPYGTGPRTAGTSPVGEEHGLRFVFDTKYETMYAEIAKMFASDEDVRANFRRVGGERMRSEAKALGDEANAKPPAPEAVPAGDGGTPRTDQDGNEDAPVDLLDGEDDDLLGFMEFGNGKAPVPTAPRSSAEQIDELVVSLTRSHQGNDIHHLVDPHTGPAQADRIRGAVGRFPRDDRFFTLASHIAGTDGAPTWRGQRVTAGELAVVLSRLADDGVWDTARPLQFAACGLGENMERSYAADTLRALRELRPGLPLTAYAPRSTLWFVPSVTGPFTTDTTGPGHTAVARKVRGADGTPRLVPGHWVKLTLATGRDAAVGTTLLGAHIPPDGRLSPDGVPATTGAPDGYPGSVPSVLAGDAGSHHVMLQGDARPDRRDAGIRRAVDANLDHYGPELEAVAEKLEHADPGRAEPRTVLARALADLRRVREEGGDPAALARAWAEAVRAFAAEAGDEYGSPEGDGHLRLGRPAAAAVTAVTLPSVDWSF